MTDINYEATVISCSDNSGKNCNFQDILEGKRYLMVAKVTAACPLAWNHRLVWSYLAYKLRDGKPLPMKRIAEVTGLDHKTIKKVLGELATYGLAKKVGEGHVALRPPDEWVAWYRERGEERREWHQLLRRFPVYLLIAGNRNGKGISPVQNALLWTLHSLRKDKEEAIVTNQTAAGLVALTGFHRNSVRTALKWLEDEQLIKPEGSGYRLLRPTDAHLSGWQDRQPKTAAEPENKRAAVNVLATIEGVLRDQHPTSRDFPMTMLEITGAKGRMERAGYRPYKIVEYLATRHHLRGRGEGSARLRLPHLPPAIPAGRGGPRPERSGAGQLAPGAGVDDPQGPGAGLPGGNIVQVRMAILCIPNWGFCATVGNFVQPGWELCAQVIL